MQGLRAFLAMLVSLVLANGVLLYVLDSNMQAGVYPTDADSIAIPFMESVSTSVLVLLAIGISVALPKNRRLWRVARAITAAFAALLSLAVSASWLSPNHYQAALGFLFVFAACIWSWWQDRSINNRASAQDVSL